MIKYVPFLFKGIGICILFNSILELALLLDFKTRNVINKIGGGGGGRGQGRANSKQAHDVVTKSMRRNDVASTSFRRHVPTRFLINQCLIITFLILKSI